MADKLTDKRTHSKEARAAKPGELLYAAGKVYEKQPDGTLKLIQRRGEKV